MFRPAVLAEDRGFAPDPRFARRGKGPAMEAPPPPPPPEPAAPPVDPFELARAEGHAAGRAEAKAEAETRAAADAAARQAFAASFARLDAGETARLAATLQETVEALCEALIGDVALDPAALARRAETAARLLSRAEDERTFRLNPEDLALVGPQLPGDWKVLADPALERGAIRIETPTGGVEDGPGNWRRAVAEAIRAC